MKQPMQTANATDTPKPATPLPWFADITRHGAGAAVVHSESVKGGEYPYASVCAVPHERKPLREIDRDFTYIVHACNRLPQVEADLAECVEMLERAIHDELGDNWRHLCAILLERLTK